MANAWGKLRGHVAMSAPPSNTWLIAAIAALSLNLRLATSAIAPLLPTIQHDTGLSAAAGGCSSPSRSSASGRSRRSLPGSRAASLPSG